MKSVKLAVCAFLCTGAWFLLPPKEWRSKEITLSAYLVFVFCWLEGKLSPFLGESLASWQLNEFEFLVFLEYEKAVFV